MSRSQRPSKYYIGDDKAIIDIQTADELEQELAEWPQRLYPEWKLIKMGEGDRTPEDYEYRIPRGYHEK